MVINLSRPQGKYGGSAKAIADLFDTVGAYERNRRELKLQESFLRKATENKDFPTIVNELMQESERPAYSGGFAGAMQRLGGVFMPPVSPMRQALLQNVMASIAPVRKYAAMPAETTGLSPEEQAAYLAKLRERKTTVPSKVRQVTAYHTTTGQAKPFLIREDEFETQVSQLENQGWTFREPERTTTSGLRLDYALKQQPGSDEWKRAVGIAVEDQIPPEYAADLNAAVDAIARIEQSTDTTVNKEELTTQVYRRIAAAYPERSAELSRILGYTPAGKRLESLRRALFGD
jgi:hypothetical protein